MKKYAVTIGLILGILLPAVVFGSTITGATYSGTVTVTNNSTAATNVAVPFSVNTTAMITDGLVNASVNNTALRSGSTDVVYMPDPTAAKWWVYVPSIAANTNLSYSLYTGGDTAMGGSMYYIPGSGGFTVADSPSLEPGANTWGVEVYLDLNAAGGNLVHWSKKNGGVDQYYLYTPSSGNVTFYMQGVGPTGNILSATVSAGKHRIRVTDDNTGIRLYVDNVLQDSYADVTPVDYNDVWTFAQGDTNYLISANITIAGTQQAYWEYQYASTFTDQTGNGHTATPTFRTTSSDADVSASLSSFAPLNPASLTDYSITSSPTVLSGNVTTPAQMYTSGNYTYIPGADAINALLDVGSVPHAAWWYMLIFGGIALLGLIMYEVTSGGNRSVMGQWIICEVLLVLLGSMNPIPLAAAFLFPVSAFAIWTSQKHQSLG